jgi:predicted nucleic acid-binding protein
MSESSVTAPCFVDANVFIYARDQGDPTKQKRANEWLFHLWREQLGRTSMQVLSEFYVTVTRKLAARALPADAWHEVQSLLAWHPQAIDGAVLTRAREIELRWRLSWWDSLIVAAAQLQDCTLLLTEDLQDGAVYGGVTVRSPFTLKAREPLPVYAAVPALRPRHRSRGRPRRQPQPA